MKRVVGTGVVGVLFLSSCVQEGNFKPITAPPPSVPPPQGGVVKVKVGGRNFSVFESLKHSVPSITLSSTFEGHTLREVVKYLNEEGIPAVCPSYLEDRPAYPLPGGMHLKAFLDRESAFSGVFWTYEDGVVKFVPYEVRIYKVPLLYSLFNTVRDDRVKVELLKALKRGLEKMLEGDSLTVSLKESGTDRKDRRGEDVTDSKELSSLVQSRKEKETASRGKKWESSLQNSKTGEEGNRFSRSLEGISHEDSGRKKKENKKSSVYSYKTDREKEDNNESRNSRTVSREVRNSILRLLGKKTALEIERSLRNEGKVAVLPTGLVAVRVTRSQIPSVDTFLKSFLGDFSSMVYFKVYLVESSKDFTEELKTQLSFLKRAYRHEFNVGISPAQDSFSFTSLSQNYLSGIVHGIDATTLVNYLKTKRIGEIVSSSDLLTIPYYPGIIGSALEVPYIEPSQVSVGGTNPTLTYEVKFAKNGLTMKFVPVVIGDNIFVNFNIRQNRFIRYQELKAGKLETLTLPVQATRFVTSTVRISPGDTLVIGGLSTSLREMTNGSNLFLPQKEVKKSDQNLYILVQVRLLKFIKGGEE